MGRHRHMVNVRTDGLAVVLGPLLRGGGVQAATLIDVDSGMVLDAFTTATRWADLERLGGTHAEMLRVALGLLDPAPSTTNVDCEIVLAGRPGTHHVIRLLPDPFGDRLALSVVFVGGRLAVLRLRRRLREISVAALTSGPEVTPHPFEVRRVTSAVRHPPPPAPHPPALTPTSTAIEPPAGPAMALLRDWSGQRGPHTSSAPPPAHRALPDPPARYPRSRDVAAPRSPTPPAALPPARRTGAW